LAGIKVIPRVIRVFNGPVVEIPIALALQLSATTDSDGKVSLVALTARDELMAVQVASDSLAEQDIVLVDRVGASTRTGPVAVTIPDTGQIAGRIVDERGQGIAGQVVEVWTRGSN
jgi:hypothetical protein